MRNDFGITWCRKKMAKYWICSESRVRCALEKFVDRGIVEVVKLGNLKHYRVKE